MNLWTEKAFRDAYEVAFGVRPVFSVDHLTSAELHYRTALIKAAFGEYR
jgi:hypothetical protein